MNDVVYVMKFKNKDMYLRALGYGVFCQCRFDNSPKFYTRNPNLVYEDNKSLKVADDFGNIKEYLISDFEIIPYCIDNQNLTAIKKEYDDKIRRLEREIESNRRFLINIKSDIDDKLHPFA